MVDLVFVRKPKKCREKVSSRYINIFFWGCDDVSLECYVINEGSQTDYTVHIHCLLVYIYTFKSCSWFHKNKLHLTATYNIDAKFLTFTSVVTNLCMCIHKLNNLHVYNLPVCSSKNPQKTGSLKYIIDTGMFEK